MAKKLTFTNYETDGTIGPLVETVLVNSPKSVIHVMAWYGCFYAGDKYTVTLDGELMPHDMNGEPLYEELFSCPDKWT